MKNNPWRQLLCIGIVVLLCLAARKCKVKEFLDRYGHYVFYVCITGMVLFLLWWVSQTGFWFFGDSEKIYMCAGAFLGGDPSLGTRRLCSHVAAPERYDTVGGFSATICRYRAKLLCDVRNPHIFLCCDYCGAVSDLLSAVREKCFYSSTGSDHFNVSALCFSDQ